MHKKLSSINFGGNKVLIKIVDFFGVISNKKYTTIETYVILYNNFIQSFLIIEVNLKLLIDW